VRSAPKPVTAPQKPPRPKPELEVTEPELEIGEPAVGSAPRPNGPPADGFAPADLQGSPDEAVTDEHRVFEATTQRGSDLTPDPVDDSLDLLVDDDLAALAPEIDLADTETAPADGDPSTRGLFDAPGTDLSTLPDPDARKKS
jgi:hypothetical protein